MTKPIHLFSYAGGPNPEKVIILLKELGIPYEVENVDVKVLHTPVFEKHNPNGRVPAIIDPNTGITLWESGAILQYLIEKYDTEHKLSFPVFSTEKYLCDQYLFFQCSGQGPYFGQAVWFAKYHPEQVQSAKDRYYNEIKRVTKVLDGVLAGKEYLVGDKFSYADLAFIPWYWLLISFEEAFKKQVEDENPNFKAWNDRLNARPTVKKVFEERPAALSGKI